MAFEWFQKSAEQGFTPAQSNLALMYRDGRGIQEDNLVAAMWLKIAANKNFDIATKAFTELRNKLTEEQMVMVDQRVIVWLHSHYPTLNENQVGGD